jgi:hypothetical protein
VNDPRPWLHGGVPGLKPGDEVLPRSITGNMNGSIGGPGDMTTASDEGFDKIKLTLHLNKFY